MPRYKLRTLMILLAIGPMVLWHIWLLANENYGAALLVAEFVLLLIVALPVVAVVMLAERRRYLLEGDRDERRRSGFFGDDWPS